VIGFLYQGGRGAIWQIAVSYKSVSWQQYNTIGIQLSQIF